MRFPTWLLAAVAAGIIPSSGQSEISVVVSQDVFERRFKGHNFSHWKDFVVAAGEQNNPGGEARLKAGFTLLFAAIATVTVGTVIGYVISTEVARPWTAWVVVFILLDYAGAVFLYCFLTYKDPAQRVVTNLLFGLVPWTVSCASYLVAIITVDLLRQLRVPLPQTETEANASRQSNESFSWITGGRPFHRITGNSAEDMLLDVRISLLLAVLPSLAISVFFTATFATGFTGVGTFFDVLALCLFVDVWRLVLHLSLLVAPQWTLIGTYRSSELSRASGEQANTADSVSLPGAVRLTFTLCLVWYAVLIFMKRQPTGQMGFYDPIKIHVLACLTSYVFFPTALALAWYYNESLFRKRLDLSAECLTATWLLMVWCSAAFMLLAATVFNATEPNTIGIVGMVFSILYAASKFTTNVPECICMMTFSTAVTFALVFVSVHYADHVRDLLG